MQDLGISVLFKGINFQRLLGGLWVTLRLALITIGLSCLFGLLFGLLMLSKRKIVQFFCRVWLEIVRFMPQLVLLYLVYFGFARLFGWDLDGETSAVIVFTFWGTAEMGDLIRGALTSIPLHQTDSANSATPAAPGHQPVHPHHQNHGAGENDQRDGGIEGGPADHRPVLPAARRRVLGVFRDLPAVLYCLLALLTACQTTRKTLGVKG